MSNVNMTVAGGWLAIAGSVVHLVATPFTRVDVWTEIFDRGVVNTVTLEPSASSLPAAEAFWLTPGSFALPLLLLGAFVVWSCRRGQRVPGWLGWPIVAWGCVAIAMVPASPAWIFPVIGILLVLGDRRPATTPANRGVMAA